MSKHETGYRLQQESVSLEIMTILARAVVILAVILLFFVPVRVAGNSMHPTHVDGQIVFCFRFGTIERGDIVAINSSALNERIIKRVIGMPGDTISIKNGDTYLNGTLLDEPYVVHRDEKFQMDEVTVPEGHCFVMGDNRPNSTDSRFDFVSFIPLDEVMCREAFAIPTIGD